MDEKVACQPKHEVGLTDPTFSCQPIHIIIIKIRDDGTLTIEPSVVGSVELKECLYRVHSFRRNECICRNQVWLLFTCNNFVITLSRVQVCTLLLAVRRIIAHDPHDVIN